MGIGGFWQWFVDNNGDSFVGLPAKETIDAEHIFVDMNGLFHVAIRKSKTFVCLF